VELIRKNKHWIGPAYVSRLISGEAKILEKDKFKDFKWATLSEIKNLELTSACKQNIFAYKKKYSDILQH